MAGRAVPIGRDGNRSPSDAVGTSTGDQVNETAVSSYVNAGVAGTGGGGTSGTTTRFDSGPLRPRVDRPKATYVRTGITTGGPTSGAAAGSTVCMAGPCLSSGTATGFCMSGVNGSLTRATV